MALMEEGASLGSAAAIVGVSVSTLVRWRSNVARGLPLVARRGPRREAAGESSRLGAERLVRELHGLIGAEALTHSIPGLSRREAAAIKKATCTSLERERKQHSQHIIVTEPGVVRGFDAMQVFSGTYWLVAADAAVPYRTTLRTVARYDGKAVASFLEADFRVNGDPVVLRLDRAKQHATREVRDVLARHQVLVLQGPPHRATYYGQLERQNREHRAWLRTTDSDLEARAMIRAFNTKWRRRTLGWKTAEEVWRARAPLRVDRAAFRREVIERTSRLRRRLAMKGKPKHLAKRLAMEQALEARGFLRRERARGC